MSTDTYECWGQEEGLTFAPVASIARLRAQGLLSENAVLEYRFEADSWEAAMTEHHKRQGWEPYKPRVPRKTGLPDRWWLIQGVQFTLGWRKGMDRIEPPPSFRTTMEPASIETVTPQQASLWLAGQSDHNRTLRERHVERLMRDMRNGTFVYNGESIKIDEEGNLMDGQHRLTAIVRSGIPQTMLVARCVPRITMRTIDRGEARTVADWLKIRGFKHYSCLSKAANDLLAFECGSLHRVNSLGKFHPSDADGVLDRHPNLSDSVSFVRGHGSGLRRVYRSEGRAGFLHYVFTQVSPEKGDTFIEKLSSGAGLESSSPILHLRARLTDDIVDTRKKLTPTTRLALILKSWNAFLGGRPMRRLRYNADEAFPKVEGFSYTTEGVPIFP